MAITTNTIGYLFKIKNSLTRKGASYIHQLMFTMETKFTHSDPQLER
jgi:hypothetical protein